MVSLKNSSKDSNQTFWDAWSANAWWRDNLARKSAYKSLGVPPDDMNIRTGIGWKELAVIAGALLGGGWLLKNASTPPPPVPTTTTPPSVAAPVASEYEVRFYDADGNVIPVPRLPKK